MFPDVVTVLMSLTTRKYTGWYKSENILQLNPASANAKSVTLY